MQGLALALCATSSLTPLGFMSGAVVALDFVSGRYRLGASGAQTSNFLSLAGASFTNSTGGYAQRADGTLVWFPANTPRITNLGLLIEGSSTNLLASSNNPNGSAWLTNSGLTVAQSGVGPDNTSPAWVITQTAANGADTRMQQNVPVANDSTVYTASWYVPKSAVSPTDFPAFHLVFNGGTTGVDAFLVLNPQTGASVNNASAGAIYRVEDKGAFWRVSITAANNATGNTLILSQFYPAWNASLTVSKSTVSGGANAVSFVQVEALAFASSYIPTASAAATRAADVAAISGLTLGAPLTLAAQGILPNSGGAGFPNLVEIDDGTTNNRLFAYINGASVQGNDALNNAGATQFSNTVSGLTAGQVVGVALRADTNNGAASWNGQGVSHASTVSVPAMNALRIGGVVGGVNQWNSYVQRIRIDAAADNDNLLQLLSAGNF